MRKPLSEVKDALQGVLVETEVLRLELTASKKSLEEERARLQEERELDAKRLMDEFERLEEEKARVSVLRDVELEKLAEERRRLKAERKTMEEARKGEEVRNICLAEANRFSCSFPII